MAEPPAEAPDPRPDGEGRSGATSRFRRPAALVVEAGALAGAILSIVGVVRLVTGDDAASTPTTAAQRQETVSIALPADPVHRLTKDAWLKSLKIEPGEIDPRDVGLPGVTVDYEVEASGYEPGTLLPVRFELWKQTATGEEPVGSEDWDYAEIDRDPDRATSTSTFLELPDPAARYRVSVGIYPPNVMSGSPLDSDDTEFGPQP